MVQVLFIKRLHAFKNKEKNDESFQEKKRDFFFLTSVNSDKDRKKAGK